MKYICAGTKTEINKSARRRAQLVLIGMRHYVKTRH